MEGDESTILYAAHLGYKIARKNSKKSTIYRGLVDISLQLFDGETLGIIGESDSGKSLLINIIAGMIKPTEGDVYIGMRPEAMVHVIDLERRVGRFQHVAGNQVGEITAEESQLLNTLWNLRDEFSLTRNSERRNRNIRKQIQALFQDESIQLDPKRTAWETIAESFERMTDLSSDEIDERISEVAHSTGIRETVLKKYPRDLNAEETQLVNIAKAISVEPRLILLDDPVAALDVSAQAQILNTLRDYQYSRGLSYIVASNNLNAIRILSDKVMVLYLGRVMEYSTTSEIFSGMLHPYTKMLISQSAGLSNQNQETEAVLGDFMPDISSVPQGCPFHTRCPVAFKHCGWVPTEAVGLVRELLAFNKDGSLKVFPPVKKVVPNDDTSTIDLVFETGTRISYEFVEEFQRLIEGRILLEGGVPLTAIDGVEISPSGDVVTAKMLKPKVPPLVESRPWHHVSCFQYGGLEGVVSQEEAEKEPVF